MGEPNGNGAFGHVLAAGDSEAGPVAFRGLGGRVVRVLAYGGMGWKHLAQDARYLYVADEEDGTVTKLSKDGGLPLILATEQFGCKAIAIADGWLYWTTRRARQEVVRMPAGGGDIEVIASGEDGPEALAVHGDTVVWTTFGDALATGTVRMRTLGGPPPTTLASRLKQPARIALDAEQIFWVNHGLKRPTYFRDGSVMRMPRPPAKKRFVIAKQQTLADSLMADDTWIYWAAAAVHDDGDASPGGVWKRRKTGGPRIRVTTWHFGTATPEIAIDATHVYWQRPIGGDIYRVPKSGGEPEHLLAEIRVPDKLALMGEILVDDRSVYWTVHDARSSGGAVFKIAK